MEVRLNKMEMTVSVCHFYNFFLPLILFTSSHSLGIYGPMQRSLSPEDHISAHWIQHAVIYLDYEIHICEDTHISRI